jgi:hypothetical protein
MPLTAGSAEAEAILAEKRAREEFIEAKTRRASGEGISRQTEKYEAPRQACPDYSR